MSSKIIYIYSFFDICISKGGWCLVIDSSMNTDQEYIFLSCPIWLVVVVTRVVRKV